MSKLASALSSIVSVLVMTAALITMIATANSIVAALGLKGWLACVLAVGVVLVLLLKHFVETMETISGRVCRFIGLFSFECRRNAFASTKGICDLMLSVKVGCFGNYVIFNSDSRKRIRVELHAGYRHSYDESDDGMNSFIAPGVFCVTGPVHSGLETLVVGEAGRCGEKNVVFVVSDFAWCVRSMDREILSDSFKEKVDQLMKGVVAGPHVVLLLRLDELWANMDRRAQALIMYVKEWYASLDYAKRLTIVLRFNSVRGADVADGKLKLGIDYLDGKECGEFAKKCAPDWWAKFRESISEREDRDKAISTYLLSETRGIPGAIIELIDPNKDTRLCEIVLQQWDDQLRCIGIEDAMERKEFYAAFCLLSLLKSESISIEDFANNVELSPKLVKRFLMLHFGKRIIDFNRFSVSMFTDLFPEEVLIRYLSAGNVQGWSEYFFGAEFVNFFQMPKINEWLHSNDHAYAELLCRNLINAFCQDLTPWRMIPTRIAGCLSLVRQVNDHWIGNRLRVLAAEYLVRFVIRQVRQKISLVSYKELGDVLCQLNQIGKEFAEPERLTLLAHIAWVSKFCCSDPLRWHVDYDFLESCCKNKYCLDTFEKTEDAFYVWAYSFLSVSKLVGRGADDRSLRAHSFVERLKGMYPGLRLGRFPGLVAFDKCIQELALCNSLAAPGRFGDQELPVHNLASAVVATCQEVCEQNQRSGRPGLSALRAAFLISFDVNVFTLNAAKCSYAYVADAVRSGMSRSNIPYGEFQAFEWEIRRYVVMGDAARVDDGWREVIDKAIEMWQNREVLCEQLLSMFMAALYLLSCRVLKSQSELEKELVRKWYSYFVSQVDVMEQNASAEVLVWYCVYLLRLRQAGCSVYDEHCGGFLRVCRKFILNFETYAEKFQRRETGVVYEMAWLLFGMSDDDVCKEIKRIFELSKRPVEEVEASYKESFLNQLSLYYSIVFEQNDMFRADEAIERALDVWSGKLGCRWQELSRVEPRGNTGMLPDAIWKISVLSIYREMSLIREGEKSLGQLFVDSVSGSLDQLERKGLIPCGEWRNLLEKVSSNASA